MVYMCEIGNIWWYNHLRHTTTENMTTMGKIDTSDLMIIIRRVIDISSRSPKVKWASSTRTTLHLAKKIRQVTERANYILDTLSIEYTQQAEYTQQQ